MLIAPRDLTTQGSERLITHQLSRFFSAQPLLFGHITAGLPEIGSGPITSGWGEFQRLDSNPAKPRSSVARHTWIHQRHDYLFKGPFRGSTLKQHIFSLRVVRPDVAVVEVLTSVTGIPKLVPGTNTDAKGRVRTRLLQVVVKEGGEWKITAYHNTDGKSDVPVPEPQ